MIISNITIICVPADLEAVVSWTRAEFIPMLADARARSPRLALVETGEEEAETRSLALQYELEDDEACRAWTEERLLPALAALAGRFGERALTFRTILRQIEL